MNDDILSRIRASAAMARDLEKTITDLEERTKMEKEVLRRIYHHDLPDLMFEAGVDKVGLPAEGNLPAMIATLGPFYQANIAAAWPEPKREAAFTWLDDNGHGDLIKTQVSVSLPREARDEAKKLISLLKDYHPEIKQSVHSGTLTAWLREQIENGEEMPPLDVIGGNVGQVVKLKERKD